MWWRSSLPALLLVTACAPTPIVLRPVEPPCAPGRGEPVPVTRGEGYPWFDGEGRLWPNGLYEGWLRMMPDGPHQQEQHRSLRVCVGGGEATPRALYRRLMQPKCDAELCRVTWRWGFRAARSHLVYRAITLGRDGSLECQVNDEHAHVYVRRDDAQAVLQRLSLPQKSTPSGEGRYRAVVVTRRDGEQEFLDAGFDLLRALELPQGCDASP